MKKYALFIIGIVGIAYFWILPGNQYVACAIFGVITGIGLVEVQK